MPIIPVHQRGYTNPQLFAETDWLANHLDDPGVRIVDARPPQQYGAGHIPGAVNLSGTNGIPRTADGEMASPEEFSGVASKLGIGNHGTIVVYDTPNQYMGLVACAFMYYGHQDVRLLDGGFEKWSREGRPVSTEEASYAACLSHCHTSHPPASSKKPANKNRPSEIVIVDADIYPPRFCAFSLAPTETVTYESVSRKITG